MRLSVTAAIILCFSPPLTAAQASVATHRSASNSEMTSIFVADQKDREGSIDWVKVAVADQNRRNRTQELLDDGMLKTGEDFYHAAFIFQHGGTAGDYLKAHALAVASAARGNPKAAWIAAATLDRYLQEIRQPQIYGTQYGRKGDAPWTQEPYDRELLPDALRVATGVPSLLEQKQRLESMKAKTP